MFSYLLVQKLDIQDLIFKLHFQIIVFFGLSIHSYGFWIFLPLTVTILLASVLFRTASRTTLWL